MLKGLGDLGQIMKMQKEMKNIQKKIQKTKIEGQSSDGSVKVTVNGEFSLLDISISEELVRSGDVKKIEKMVSSAVNDAITKAKDFSAEEMKKIAGGMDLGSLFK
ncbi:MAG TPA: YbaB/EbfC family nucleoid-associated protein [Spirochaetota bacterium]|jgi:DNA-binding YbaB/EbfC family protein|nr:YbaB/EbfC family nucleoid-associated protein [Spirochaetota bacterium]OQA98901.1 MAG: Nucleoid-associated protein YbaB [Spirochaetes bacterium ADurb.Bin218]HOK02303.1 YbaB/EbfC family nucleoid-associated protein [Spirochaetota bacterium]HOK92449.1 YbaB/EbfC family nucleoid-associated protein [Spirochaetota bacterium]HON15440.1 YbaB/EbfC family nucleoid-associated protein [Spirochaetota bacterium]